MNKFVTVPELAAYLHMRRQAVIDYFIKKDKVLWEKVSNRYRIDLASFRRWEKLHTIHPQNRGTFDCEK